MMLLGRIHKILHIVWQMPWQVVILANNAILSKCCDEGDDH
jgi:hypothetical protein